MAAPSDGVLRDVILGPQPTDAEAAEPRQGEADGREGPCVVERVRRLQRCRRSDDRDHRRDAERGTDLPGHRVEAGRGGERLARGRGDRGAAQVREQGPGSDAEQDHPGQPLPDEVGRDAHPR